MELKFIGFDKLKEVQKIWWTTNVSIVLFVCCYFFSTFSGLAQFDGKPIVITPSKRTIVQRCFVGVGEEKRIFCVAVGEPQQIHYIMDLSQGALLNLWKGDFLDATTMWTGRGEEQLAHPLGGKVIKLSPKPAFALLQNKKDAWPDEEQTTNTRKFKGYTLDEHGRPTFNYKINGASIQDKITPEKDYQSLVRILNVSDENNQNKLWFRLASGNQIKRLRKGMYSIDDKSYYIKVVSKKNQKPLIRKVESGMELLVPIPITSGMGQLKYSIIW